MLWAGAACLRGVADGSGRMKMDSDQVRARWQAALADADAQSMDHGRDVPSFFAETVPELGRLGYFGLMVPEEYGGSGYSVAEYVAALQVLGEQDLMAAYSVNEHSTIGSLPLVEHGTPEQKDRWLPDIATGRRLAAFCLTEPASGSDVTSLATKAVPADGGHHLTGKKIHISLAHNADLFIVLAEIPREGGKDQKTAFVIERGMAGFGHGPENSSPSGYLIPVAGSVELDDCHADESRVLGGIGGGGSIFRSALEIARVGLASAYVGGAIDALQRCLERATSRTSFKQPIGEHQLIQAKLADMSIGSEAGKLLVAAAAQAIDEGSPDAMAASARAKVFVTETVRDIGVEAVQIFGGQAFLEERRIDWYLRDAKMGEILGGTSEIMRILLAKDLLKKFDGR